MRITSSKGDAIDINGNLTQNITGWSIRAELWDNSTSPVNAIRKATSDVTGGGTDQIEITDVVNGKFTIHFDTGETTDFTGDVILEIEVEDNSSPTRKKFTVYSEYVNLSEERIKWIDVT